jgi:hypothetical protein
MVMEIVLLLLLFVLLLKLIERFLNFDSARDCKRYGGHGGIRYWAFGAQDGRRVG